METVPSDNTGSISAKVKSDIGATKRAKQFRERLASTDLKRWEIFTTEDIKSVVREIAQKERLSVGIASEALLNLGIETFLSKCKASVECELPDSKPPSMSDAMRNSNNTPSAPSAIQSIIANSTSANKTYQVETKPLASYSSRTSLNTADPAPTKPSIKVAAVPRVTMASAFVKASLMRTQNPEMVRIKPPD